MTMAQKQIDYYFSFVSLWSYIGCGAFAALVAKHDLRVNYKPIDLMAVFKAGGGLPVKERPIQRQAYRLVEMQRWRALRQIPLVLHPRFYPADPSRGHRMLLAAQRAGHDIAAFSRSGLTAVWADEKDIADADTLVSLADAAGLPGAALLAESEEPALRREEQRLTEEAIGRKIFGAPFYFYRDEPFWGQDRLDMLDAVLTTGRPPIVPE